MFQVTSCLCLSQPLTLSPSQTPRREWWVFKLVTETGWGSSDGFCYFLSQAKQIFVNEAIAFSLGTSQHSDVPGAVKFLGMWESELLPGTPHIEQTDVYGTLSSPMNDCPSCFHLLGVPLTMAALSVCLLHPCFFSLRG